ncbi:MAG TPA: DNA replication/repair protein RecF [Acidimicrobiales bacterium]|nr:DNA replication/repair protein RecF [Acidimicrobiales bacterium]
MYLETLWLTDFRSYTETEFCPASDGITVVTGANGAGKTNLIEAVGYLATLRSLRGSPSEAMVRSGAAGGTAIVRARIGRPVEGSVRRTMIEAELHAAGRDRVQVNGQSLRRTRDLLGSLQVTVFSPDDLALVKGGPGGRRELLDDLLVGLHPRRDALLGELERILKQRNALLKSAFGSGGWRPGRPLPDDVRFTLDVWDSKLTAVGEELVAARTALVADLEPLVGEAYAALADGSAVPARQRVNLAYRTSWDGPLAAALVAARDDDLRRGVTTVGPQRDDLDLTVGDLPARTHASQGEQRTLALALRLAGHRLIGREIGSPPVLLLDDVFSELDRARAEALMRNLPSGQAILTTAGDLPPGAEAAARFRVEAGKLLP